MASCQFAERSVDAIHVHNLFHVNTWAFNVTCLTTYIIKTMLSRAKSIVSIHAQTAANIAMERSHERASAESGQSAGLPRHHSNAATPAANSTPRSQGVHFAAAHELRRERSGLQTQSSDTASTFQWFREDQHAYPTHRTHSTCHAHPSPARPSRLDDDFVLPPSEFGTTRAYGSVPSSYRRLRKARSMFTPGKRASSLHDFDSRGPKTARRLRKANSTVGGSERGFRTGLKRSMSFIRGSSGNLTKAFKKAGSPVRTSEEAVQLAREQFLHDFEQRDHQHHPPSLNPPKIRPEQKAFRRSVRSNRTTDFGDGVKSENQIATGTKPGSRMRSFSSSIRNTVKRVFRKSPSTIDKIPTQQLDASRTHFRDYVGCSTNQSSFDDYCAAERSFSTITARPSLYVPPSFEEGSLEDFDKITSTLKTKRSIDSLHSNNKSRVTSWANSSISDSTAVRNTPIERKRLSIIQEHGSPYQPSSSIGRHLDEVGAYEKPYVNSVHPAAAVDAQRVYSALIKRIDQEQTAMDRAQTPATHADVHESTHASAANGIHTAPSIRAVPSEGTIRPTAPDEHHRQLSLYTSAWNGGQSMTLQQIAQHNENIEKQKSRGSAQHVQSSFFPFSSESKPSTPSPLKLALAARRSNQQSVNEDTGSVIINRTGGNQVHGSHGTSSESVSAYSRTTGGHTAHFGSSQDLFEDLENEQAPSGMATIIPTRISRYSRPTSSATRSDRESTNTTKDLKLWRESKATSLDRRDSRSSTHYRENADINDEAIRANSQCFNGSTQPDHSAKGVGKRPQKHIFREAYVLEGLPSNHRSHPSDASERFPLLDLEQVPRYNTPAPKRSSSLKRTLSADTKRPSTNGMNDENAPLDGSRKPMLPLRNKYSFNSKVGDTPPQSMPGRLHVSNVGRTPQAQKKASFATLKDFKLTPKKENAVGNGTANSQATARSHYTEINDENDKNMARLSRPFDSGAGVGNGGERKVSPTLRSESLRERLQRCASFKSSNIEPATNRGRRMVSNFLWSRRTALGEKKREASGSSSPAFV